MTDFNFDEITEAQAASFRNNVDRLIFRTGTGAGRTATAQPTDVTAQQFENATIIVFGGKTVQLPNGANQEAFGFDDFVFAGAGGGTTTTAEDANLFLGNAMGDSTSLGNGNDRAFGFNGDDTINGGNGDDVVDGGDGVDTLNGDNGNDTLNGDAGNDTLSGEAGDDSINGGDGDDLGSGGEGNDTLNGAAGNDTLNGNMGNDVLNGEAGDDQLNGQAGNDIVSGGDGFDILTGGLGNDTLSGDAGTDFIEGNAGDDVISGDQGEDRLFGGQGNDLINGGRDNDVITGGADRDTIGGDQGRDDLFGNEGNDRLEGGEGADFLVGGTGADEFVFFGRTPGVGDSPLSNRYFRNGPNLGSQEGDVVDDFSVTEGDVLDFFVSGTGRYVEEQSIIQNANSADPSSAYESARALAELNLRNSAPGVIFSAVQIGSDMANQANGTIIFFDTNGDDVVDQQVFLQGVTVGELANDGSFIV